MHRRIYHAGRQTCFSFCLRMMMPLGFGRCPPCKIMVILTFSSRRTRYFCRILSLSCCIFPEPLALFQIDVISIFQFCGLVSDLYNLARIANTLDITVTSTRHPSVNESANEYGLLFNDIHDCNEDTRTVVMEEHRHIL